MKHDINLNIQKYYFKIIVVKMST